MSKRINPLIPQLKKAVKVGKNQGRALADIADEMDLAQERTAKLLADLIMERYPILWDGKYYFIPRDPTEVLDFAVEHPQHFRTILYVWKLSYRIKLRLEKEQQQPTVEQKEKMNVRKTDTNT